MFSKLLLAAAAAASLVNGLTLSNKTMVSSSLGWPSKHFDNIGFGNPTREELD